MCVYMHVHMYIYIYMHTCIFLVVYIEVRCNLATFRVSPSEKIFSSSKFVGSTGLGRRKIAQTFSLSPWRLVVGPFRYFWLVAWISARKPGSKSSIYGFTINRWGCNGYTWIFAINEGNKYMYIYIYTCFNLFIWVTVQNVWRPTLVLQEFFVRDVHETL